MLDIIVIIDYMFTFSRFQAYIANSPESKPTI